MNIAIIGAGTMGNGIAHVFAQAGYKVSLIDVSPDALKKGMDTIGKNLDRMLAKEKISATEKENTLKNISTYSSVQDGVREAAVVVEAATENADLKFKIFRNLDQLCHPNTILATNTSSISITRI